MAFEVKDAAAMQKRLRDGKVSATVVANENRIRLPYTFLGPVDYVSHKGERPIAFTWKLQRPMPADFFRAAKVASA